MMKFDTLPTQCLVDHSLEIRVRGAVPGEAVVLKLGNRFKSTVFLSEATFEADAAGVIDLVAHAPISGSYDSVNAMGLFWSRVPITGELAAAISGLSDDPLTTTLTAESADGRQSISHAIRRVYLGPGVTSRAVDANGLVGKLFEPPGTGPHPALLVLGGSGGGIEWSQETAALMASHGYLSLALAYFAAEGLPPTLDRIPLEYFGTALQWLAAQPTAAADRIGVIGASRGGELALLLGASYPVIRTVVAYVPSGIVHGAYPENGFSAWTLGGKEIPFSESSSAEERAGIAVERINGSVLMISGIDDQLWPSTELTDIAVRRFQRNNFPHRVEHLRYKSAGHSIGWPNGPTTTLHFRHPVSGEEMNAGGTPEGTARARSDSWARMLEFVRDALAGTPPP
ncbi:acyl-CoA thioesterase/bile acid-CoA:amino acid N-acyltransferase family protein [Variovorax sp.]|uniref:acyl-CoA thioesterase/bile acid-CoA:amino acid N-acyltransferase family protein n=2 Tax=Variovorax sp. TaxID=1871043 RepID=UPI003BACAA20